MNCMVNEQRFAKQHDCNSVLKLPTSTFLQMGVVTKAEPEREAGENLVSEQKDEGKERRPEESPFRQ